MFGMHERTCLDVDGDRGFNATNDIIGNTIGTIDRVRGIQHHHITGVGKVIRVRDLRKSQKCSDPPGTKDNVPGR